MRPRAELHEILCNVLGSRNVYFQPPETIKLKYPAIIYSRDNIRNYHANDNVYNQMIAYQLMIIDKNPDSNIVQNISKLPLCQFNRHYVADNLNHDIFLIYF